MTIEKIQAPSETSWPPANLAPEGQQWFCMACSKRDVDLYGTKGSSWDESCSMNAVLVDVGMLPTSAQAKEFSDRREQMLIDLKFRSNNSYEQLLLAIKLRSNKSHEAD